MLLAAKKISAKFTPGNTAGKLSLGREDYPLLVVGSDSSKRTAAFATDAAPHWCGGMVDWGRKSLRLHVKDSIWIEVGDLYVRFFSNFLNWLAGKP